MVRWILAIILIVHAGIHTFGFLKAYFGFNQIDITISKVEGLFWLLAAILIIASIILFLLEKNEFIVFGIFAVIVSQCLIFLNWQETKFGSIPNILLLITVLLQFAYQHFESKFISDVRIEQEQISRTSKIITEDDLAHLPPIVKAYLIYTGCLDKPYPRTVSLVFKGEMRKREGKWFSFQSKQFNTFTPANRFFFMEGSIKGLPFAGYHRYHDGLAKMNIKALSLFNVTNSSGKELNQAETVTFFNDLCLFVPAWLTNQSIRWEEIDRHQVKATLTINNITVSSILVFNEAAQLINFVSDDRYDISGSEVKNYRFSTPVSDYRVINGYRIGHYGQAVWHYPEGEFIYGKFYLQNLEYD